MPALRATTEKRSPVSRACEAQWAVLLLTVCGSLSSLVHVIRVPRWTTMRCGPNLKSLMATGLAGIVGVIRKKRLICRRKAT